MQSNRENTLPGRLHICSQQRKQAIRDHRASQLKQKMWQGLHSQLVLMELLHCCNDWEHWTSQGPAKDWQGYCMTVLLAAHGPATDLAWWGEIPGPPLAEGAEPEVMQFTALASQSGRGAPDVRDGSQTTQLTGGGVWAVPLTSKVHMCMTETQSQQTHGH